MKIPINCPICNNILLNELSQDIYKRDILRKTCKNAKHDRIFFQSSINCEDIDFLTLNLKEKNAIFWEFNVQNLIIVPKSNAKVLVLPWFEPDFSNYKKLLNKIKTYILFS